jgi:Flp pilus assembly protein TadG
MRRRVKPDRSGVTAIECALVYPLMFLLLIGLLVGGMGIFRYQEMSWLAREGARYAVVRGMEYEMEMKSRGYTTTKAATADNIRDHVRGLVHVINPNDVQVTVTWQDQNSPYTVLTNNGQAEVSTVTVTVSHTWLPELFFAGPIQMSSTCTIPMSY